MGIDVMAHRTGGIGLDVGQCKCHKDFPPKKIRDVSDEFLEHWGYWSSQGVTRFILFVACDMSNARRQGEILKQKKRFRELGVEYEVWSAAQIRNKLMPHGQLVSEYLGEHWVPIICGKESSIEHLAVGHGSLAPQIVSAAVLKQVDRLSEVISGQVAQLLQGLSHDWRKGNRLSVLTRVREIRNDSDIWIATSGEMKARILRFEASLELQISNDVQAAIRLADEARSLMPGADESRLRTLIALKEDGPVRALQLVTGDEIDDINLKAALLLEIGDLDAAKDTLALRETHLEANPETLRLKALTELLSKNVAEAIRVVQVAREKEPDWVSIKHACAVIDYFAALSPAVLPGRIVSWPSPVPWSLVKREQAAKNRIRSAAEDFKELASDVEDREELNSEAWLLACLANHPDRQGEAADYCAELLEEDPTFYPAVAWALARGYTVDLSPSLNALENLVENKTAEVPHIISLVDCYVDTGKPEEAVRLLEQTQDAFVERDKALLTLLQSMAVAATGDPEKAMSVASADSGPTEPQALTLALRAAAEATGEWKQLATHLEVSHKETRDPIFLIELCELKAKQKDWSYIAGVTKELVETIQTAEAVRLAAAALFNCDRKRECLNLLDEHRELFPDGKLSSELSRMRALCQSALGMLPEAVRESATLAEEDGTTDNLLHLAEAYVEIGDFKNLAIMARQLRDRADLPSEHSVRLAQLLAQEDRELAISFWRKSAKNAPDETVGVTLATGYQLGLDGDVDLQELLRRLPELGAKGKAGVRTVSLDEIVAYAREYQDQTLNLREAYTRGTVPAHVFARGMSVPLAEIYNRLPERNEASPDPFRQSPIFARHGGRPETGPSLNTSRSHRLNLDITAVLLAEHLGILGKLEAQFKPLRVSYSLMPALLEMRDKAAVPQPSKLAWFEEITRLVDGGGIRVTESVPSVGQNKGELAEPMGQKWMAQFELARSNHGYLVDFLPLRQLGRDNPAPSLPQGFDKTVVNCRAVAEALRQHGPLSQSQLDLALSALGNEGSTEPMMTIPSTGRNLYLFGSTAETLSSASLLRPTCEQFEVFVGREDFEQISGELNALESQLALSEWLSSLIEHISQGIVDGTYQVLPAAVDLRSDNVDSPILLSLLELAAMETEERDIVWVDDRYVNAYATVGSVPITDTVAVLQALFERGALTEVEYFAALSRLRAGNIRYLPVTKAELAYHLSQAYVSDDGTLVETQELQVIRRYLAACLVQSDSLQRPPMPASAPNPKGEVAFVQAIVRACPDAIVEVWTSGSLNECVARSEWLLANVYLDPLGMSKSTSLLRKDVDPSYLAALGLASLISAGFNLSPFASHAGATSRRKMFFEWLDNRLLQPLGVTEREFTRTVAQLIKSNTIAAYESLPSATPTDVAMKITACRMVPLPFALTIPKRAGRR